MRTKKLIMNAALVMSLGVLYTGCDKTKEEEVLDTGTETEQDNSVAENAFADVFKSVTEVADVDGSLRSRGCATVTIKSDSTSSTGFPKTVTIDYSKGNCSGKKGKFNAIFSGRWRSKGTIVTLASNDTSLTFTGRKMKFGIVLITNMGDTLGGKPKYSITVTGANVYTPAGPVGWTSTRTVTWIEGDTTSDTMDDVYLIEGSTTGTSARGSSYSAVITTPLRVATACPWVESGVITITPRNKKTRIIDFGNTGCDNKATVTINGTSYDITL